MKWDGAEQLPQYELKKRCANPGDICDISFPPNVYHLRTLIYATITLASSFSEAGWLCVSQSAMS